jgi:hypothetical protein
VSEIMTVSRPIRPELGTVPRNGLTWKPYVYQGRGYDVLTPELGDAFGDTAHIDDIGLKPHGTPAAYRRHRRRGEDACRACKDAESQRQAAWKNSAAYAERRRERYAGALDAGLSRTEAQAVRDGAVRCGNCGYLVAAPGHKLACEVAG